MNYFYYGLMIKDSSSLCLFSIYGNLSVVEYIVYQKADINPKDKDGETPLGLASKSRKNDDEC